MVDTSEASAAVAGASDRIRTSGDSEVSTYLEIAEARAPGQLLTPAPEAPEAIVVLDYGSQFSMLITRRIREAGVYAELAPWDTPSEKLSHLKVKGFVLSGGPASVYDEGAPTLPPYVVASGTAGARHLLRDAVAGAVARRARRSRLAARVRARGDHALRAGQRAAARAARDDARLDVALRPHRRAAARLPLRRLLRRLADRGDVERRGLPRHPVPPGGGAHAAGQPAAAQLPLRGRRLLGRLDSGQLRRGVGPAPFARAGRQRAGDLRALRRGRLGRGGRRWCMRRSATS